jgi:spore germination protein KC
MKRIILLLVIIIFVPISTIGCFNYRDINRTIFVTTIAIDIDSFDNCILYVETFIPARGDQVEIGAERKTSFKSEAKSLFEAARNLSLMSNYKFSYSQCRAIIFTPKAAKYGLDNFLDLFARSQTLPLRSFIFITSEDIENFINTSMEEEQYTGIFLSELAQNATESSKGTTLRIDEFLNNRLLGSKVNLINIIELKKDQKASRIQIMGLAVINDDKLTDTLSFQESMAFNFLSNTFEKGTINTTNPEHGDKLVTLEILRNNTKSKLRYDGEKIYVKKIIKSNASFAFSQKSIHITDSEQRNEIKNSSEECIKKICKKLFDDYKEKNIDIFNIEREMKMKYPRVNIKDCMKITELEIEANVDIKGSTEIMNFQ